MSSFNFDFAGDACGLPPAAACQALQPALSAYMDGELDPGQSGALLHHLEKCPNCAAILGDYRAMSEAMRALPAPEPPAELALRLRVEASHYSVRGQRWLFLRLRWMAALQTLALPAVVGTVAALSLFVALAGGVHSNIVNNPLLPDVPVFGNATPPRLTSMPSYSVGRALLVQAQIDATGRVYGYRVLSGSADPQTIARLNNQLLLGVFQPATTIFGQPTTGSLLVSFDTVDVRG